MLARHDGRHKGRQGNCVDWPADTSGDCSRLVARALPSLSRHPRVSPAKPTSAIPYVCHRRHARQLTGTPSSISCLLYIYIYIYKLESSRGQSADGLWSATHLHKADVTWQCLCDNSLAYATQSRTLIHAKPHSPSASPRMSRANTR